MSRRHRILSTLVATAAAASMFVAGDGVAGARATAEAEDAGVTSDVFGAPLDQFLESYPDARPLAGGAYELEPGVRLVPPGAASDTDVGVMEGPSNCPDQWFCIYQHANFEGWGMQLYYCEITDLQSPYRNNVSSVHNAQNSASGLFVDTGPSPDVGRYLGPNSYLRNLRLNPMPGTIGGNWNDRIDTIVPC
jgi:hypothetical protein